MNSEVIDQERFKQLVSKFPTVGTIFVLGDIGLDKYTYGSVNRISPEAPVPVLEVQKEWLQLGLAANICNNLERLGVHSSMCGVIGNDEHAQQFLNRLAERSLDDRFVVRSKFRPTTYKERITTATQQICRVDYESTDSLNYLEQQGLEKLTQQGVENHAALIIEDYAKGVITESFIGRVIAAYKEQNKLVTVDPARNRSPLLYKGATLLKPNLVEARSMVKFFGYEATEPGEIAQIICDKLDIEKLIITLGPEGMAILDRSTNAQVTFIPTVASEVFDVSGAGDTVISVLTTALLAGANLMEAAWLGNCAAGVVVAKKGTATVSVDELNAFYQQMVIKLN